MPGHRKNYSSDLKAKVALEAIRGQKTANEIAAEYGIHPTQIAQWKNKHWMDCPISSRHEEVIKPKARKH